MHYLGHVVGKEGIYMDHEKIKIVTKSHKPLAIGQLHFSWGLQLLLQIHPLIL